MFKLALVSAFLALAAALDDRIVGGEAVEIEDYPYQLSLQYFGSHICGASIISQNFAVTAAHCTDGLTASSLTIRAGSTYRGSGGQVVQVSAITQNPNYNKENIDYDISVLRLSMPLNFGAGVQAVGLPSLNQQVPVDTDCIVSGWGAISEGGGSPSQLQAVHVRIISVATCKSAYGSAAITDRMICAGYTNGGMDACQGDSGGPLVVDGQLIGVVSWGYGCARPNYPGVYSSVPNLRNFITDSAGI
ncbi:PREDICTED: trypsin-7-like [Nicrophorus vespilloides]|uniref:Trypsin-7-like n=1 Tax=Nicrophorus vespilloides TaxID=110193 RepID=A0ABM1M4I0_NICVS|nr:PREDICTED: trypsin-7-like [Nicrophorus vespilloides]